MARNVAKETFWRGKMDEYEKRGVTVRAFCAQEGLKEVQFHYWRRALKEASRQTGFVELIRSGGMKEGAGVSIRVDDRLSIAVERGFDADTLKAALVCVLARDGAT